MRTLFDAITTLEPEHLDHPMFMKQFATEMRTGLHGQRLLVLHGDSSFTEETIQQGVPRQEAAVQTARQLNRRLVALLADEGVSALGITLMQRNFTTFDATINPPFRVNDSAWQRLPAIPVICCATIVDNQDNLVQGHGIQGRAAKDSVVEDSVAKDSVAKDTPDSDLSNIPTLLPPNVCQDPLKEALAIPIVKALRSPESPALDPASATVFAS
jgi:hypothetical protein